MADAILGQMAVLSRGVSVWTSPPVSNELTELHHRQELSQERSAKLALLVIAQRNNG